MGFLNTNSIWNALYLNINHTNTKRERKMNTNLPWERERERERAYVFYLVLPRESVSKQRIIYNFFGHCLGTHFSTLFFAKGMFWKWSFELHSQNVPFECKFFSKPCHFILTKHKFWVLHFQKVVSKLCYFFFSSSLRANWQTSFYFFSSSSSISFVFLLCFFHPPWLPFAKDVSNS